mgnify:FL=1
MTNLLFRGISAVLFNNKDGAFHVACQMAGNGTHEKALESAAASVAHNNQVAVFFKGEIQQDGSRIAYTENQFMRNILGNEFF